MKHKNHRIDLDQRLSAATPGDMPEPDVQSWLADRQADIEVLQRQGKALKDLSHNRKPQWQWLRVAAILLLLLGLGFQAGRISSLQQDMKELHAQWNQSLKRNSEDLRTDILQQLHQDVDALTQQTRVISEKATQQQLDKLIVLIEETRRRDRSQVVAALEQIQRERYRDRLQFSSGLQALAVRTQDPQELRTH